MYNRRISYSRIIGVAVLIILLIFGLDILKRNAARKTADQDLQKIIKTPDDTAITTAPPITEAAQAVSDPQSSYIKAEIDETRYNKSEKKKSDLGIGELVLVNSEHAYDFPDISESIAPIYDNMNTESYKLSYLTHKAQKSIVSSLNSMMDEFYRMYGHNDVTINSAFRTSDDQDEMYVADDSEYISSENGFASGFTEHHTGYAIDLILVSDGSKISQFDGNGDYSWISENCYKYGFIQRYPEGKESVTGVGYEPWHLRYVGVPHSYIMHENGFTLEEYITDLKKYVFGYEHLEYELYGYNYEIFYVPCDVNSDVTVVPVPNDRVSTVSGNNSDGYIVTICTAGESINKKPGGGTGNTTAAAQ